MHPLPILLLAVSALAIADCPTRAGELVTIAGNGKAEYTGNGRDATRAGVGGPFGLVVGPDGAIYVCETTNHVIRRIDGRGIASTVAGTGVKGYSGDNGPADKAQLNEPYEVRFDGDGNMFFVEMRNHVVRRIDASSGVISTVAGTGEAGFSGDGGPATKATFQVPHSIEIVGQDLYVCDIGNHRVRRVDLGTGRVETVLGNGKKAATPNGRFDATSPVNGPRALAYDPQRNHLWLALREGNVVHRIDLEKRTIEHLAGTGKKGYTGDGGPAIEATLSGPKGASVDLTTGDLYIADTESHTIRVIRAKSGVIETVVGDGKQGNGPDGDPRHCRLDRPHGVFLAAHGKARDLYIGDSNNNVVRKLSLPAAQ